MEPVSDDIELGKLHAEARMLARMEEMKTQWISCFESRMDSRLR